MQDPGASSAAAGGGGGARPQCTITPIFRKDPPLWDGQAPMSRFLHELMVPLPWPDSENVEVAVW